MKVFKEFLNFKKTFVVLASLIFLCKAVVPDVETCFLSSMKNGEIQSSFFQIVKVWAPLNHDAGNSSAQGAHCFFECHGSHNCKFLSGSEVGEIAESSTDLWNIIHKNSLEGPFFEVPIKPPIS